MKLDGYFAVPSIKHYLIVDWEEREITHYRCEGSSVAKPSIISDGILTLDPLGLALDVTKAFQNG